MSDQDSQEAQRKETATDTPLRSPISDKSPQKITPGTLPPWRVILHNDDVSELEIVIKIIQELTTLGEQEATIRALEAHQTGVALLLVTHQERAELYVEQFTSYRMTVTAEPDT